MALTFEEYVSDRRRNEQTAGAGKLSFDDYVKMTPQQTAPQNDALMDLAMETVQAKTHNDNHDVLHGVFTPKTTKAISGDIAAPVGKIADLLSIPSGNVSELPKLFSSGVQALKNPESAQEYFGIKQKAEPVNQNPAADFYLRQKQNQQAEEIKKQQDDIITQIKVIDKKREAAKREANSGTTMRERANLSGLANTAARENAQAYMEDKYANLRELDRQRAELIDQLHAIGEKYGVGDFVGDFLDSFQSALQTPLATLDKTDYWASANAGLISPEDQAAYDRAHALENDIAQQTAAAKSGRGKAGQVVMDAAAAAGNVLGSTAFAYATGIPQAAQQVLGPVAANLSATEAQLGAKAGERVAAGAQRFAGNLLGDIVTSPTNLAISAQSGIGAYDRAKTAGASETAAFAAAIGNAAAEYFSNKMFSGTPLLDSPEEKGYVVELIEAAAEKAGRSGQVQALFNNGLVSYVFDKSGEGLEEVITGVLDPLIERLTYNPDADRATAEELFNEFIGGVAMSILLGATEPVTNFQGRKAEARANEAAAAAYNAATGGASLESTVRELQRQGNTQTVEDLRPAYEAGVRALDTAAKLTGVDTEGKTGMEIRRDVDAAAEAKKTAPLSDAEILNMALSENNKLSDEGKAVAREMYNLTRGEDTAPLDFIAGFNDVYDAARRGESPDSIQSEAAARLTPQARAAAYDAGLEAMKADTAERYNYSVRENDGEYTVVVHDTETGRDNPMQPVSTREEADAIVNNFKGVTENAESGSQGEIRDAGVPGREGRGGLRERAEKNRAWRETRKRDAEGIRNRIKAAGDGEEVSAKEAGISGGTDAKTMSIVRTYRDADMRKMEAEAAAHGVKVVFFSGEIEARKGGKTIKARGEYSADGKTFYVAVDDPDFTARQIFDHEDFHARAHTDAELQQICEDIIKGHSAAELQEIVNAYVNTYGWTSMSDEDILQEILADAYAGIDVFQYLYSFEGATQFTEAVRGAVKAREGEQQTERGPPAEDEAPGKFSMKAPVEETRTLVAQHNLTEEKLRRMQQLGAIPAPSIAIVQAKEGHTNFGEYSIVFPRSTIDPQTDYRNRIYGSDAWTPTSANARVEYPVNYKALKSVEEKIDRLSGQIAGGVFRTTSLLRSMGIDNTSDMTLEEIARRMADKDAVRAAYLADRGQTLEPEKREKTWNRNFSNDTLRRFVDEVGAQRLAQITSDLWEGVRMEEALGNDMERVRQAMRDEYAERGESLLQRMAQKHGWSEKEINAKREERIDRSMERINYYQIEDFVKDAWQMYEDGGATKGEVDSLATSDKLRNAVDRKDAEKWALEQIEDLLGEPGVYNGKDIFTPSGRSRTFAELHYPYTAEGIVQAMYGSTDGSRGVGLYGAGANGLVSVATPEYDSVEAIHKDEKRLQTLTEEEYKERLAAIDSGIDTFVRSVKQNNEAHAASSYEEGEIIGSILIDAAQGRRTASGVQKTFRNEGYNLTEEQAKSALALYKKAATIPTSYFEAKPERVVNFGEALAIIIPDNAPADIKQFAKNSFADVIEYKAGNDQDRIEKVNSVEGARFSQKLTAEDELRQQNDELQKLVDYWRGQTKRTTAPAVRADDAEKVARDFVKSYNSKLDVKDAAAAVKALAEYIQSENVTFAEVKDRAYGIARDVVENAEALREGDGATYDEVKTALKKPLIISAQDAHDISPEWGAWRNANVGKVNVSINGKGTPVDVAYAELSERFPSLFPESITHPADQVQQMVDVVNELAPVYENPFSYNMAEAIEYCANDLISRVYGENIRMAPPTFADKAAARLEAEKARGAEKVARVREQKNAEIADLKARNARATAQRIAEVRKQRDAKIAALKEHYAESRRTASERKADSAARTRLLKIIRRLNNKKLPAVNRAWLEEKIGDLDTVAKSITGETIMDLTRLRSWYDNQKANNPDFIADAATEAKIARLSQTQISDLTPSQVAELTEVLLNFENEINTQRKLIDSLDKRDTRQMVLESLYNVEETKGSKKTAADWIVTNTLSPERLVKRLTGYAETDPLLMRTRDLADGQRRMFDYQRRAEKKFSRWANDKKLMERLRSKERIKITGYSNGRAVEAEITPDMRMALYLHSLNDENMKHIANGGITIPDIGIYLKGDIGEAYNRGKTLKLSPSNVRSIAAGMSAEERAFARAAHDYFNGMSRDEINAVSEKLVGYSIAGVEDYFPIETDKNFTKADIAELKRDGTIEGMGFLKERQKASNAIYLVPMTDVLNKSIQNHAKYVGMAIPVRNFSKVWGMNAHNDAAGEDNGLRQAIGQKWGERGIKAIERIISDVQNPSRSEDGKLLASIRSNYAAAVLTLNASVALKQAASYPTAAAVLGWEPLLKAMGNVGSVNLDLIDKYTPLQWYRSKGFSTQELGDIRNKGGVMDKVLSASIKTKDGREIPLLNWIQGVDLLTTRKLWKASEYYVQQHNADLERGSDAYYKAVADIYNKTIEQTQPNYTTMQRPQILRSSNQLLQSLVMFKTQPFQNFNILYDAIGELRAAERAAKNGDKSRLTQAKKNAANAISSNLVSAVVFAAMTMAWAYARRKKDKYEDKEGTFSPWKQLGKDVLSSELGMVPFGSDAYNLLSSWVFGDKYYGMSNITAESISGALDATKKAVDTLSGVVTALLDGNNATNADPENVAKELFDCAKDLSKIVGIPLENVVNLMTAVYTNVASGVNGEYVTGYELLRSTKNMESSYNKSAAYDMLYKARNQDMEQYNELRRMMIEDGFKEKNIDAAMKKRAENK